MDLLASDLKIFLSELSVRSFTPLIIFANCFILVFLPLKSFTSAKLFTQLMYFGFCLGCCSIQVFGFYAGFLKRDPGILCCAVLLFSILLATYGWHKRTLKPAPKISQNPTARQTLHE